jgi:hypothetical protein
MPCYHCGTRQVDPDRGESPWKRGVRGDQQVLICPGCQSAHDWTADLDHCPACAGVRLVRRLGEAECKDCGWVRPPVASALPGHLAVLARTGRAAAGGGAAGPAGTAAGPAGTAGSDGLTSSGGLAGSDGLAGSGGLAGAGRRAGASAPARPGSQGGGESAAMQELAAEVEQALARVLGRTAGSAAGG